MLVNGNKAFYSQWLRIKIKLFSKCFTVRCKKTKKLKDIIIKTNNFLFIKFIMLLWYGNNFFI